MRGYLCTACRDVGHYLVVDGSGARFEERCDCEEARLSLDEAAELEALVASLIGPPMRVAGLDPVEVDEVEDADGDCNAGDCATCGGSGGGDRPWHCLDCDGTGRVLREVRHAA